MFLFLLPASAAFPSTPPPEPPKLQVHWEKNDTYSPVPIPRLKYRGMSKIEVPIIFVQDADSPEGCGLYDTTGVIACSPPNPRKIVMPNPCQYPEQDYARVLCHELGHARGWNSEHNN